MPKAEQLAALRQGRMGAARTCNTAPVPDHVAHSRVRHPVVLAVPAASPLAARVEIGTADRAGQPTVGFRRRASPHFVEDEHARPRAAGVEHGEDAPAPAAARDRP
jgi:hypothetical protein